VRKLKRGELVYIETDDIEHHNHGWIGFKKLAKAKPKRFIGVGWVVKASKRTLVIAPLAGNGAAFCAYRLPRGSVRRIRKLKA